MCFFLELVRFRKTVKNILLKHPRKGDGNTAKSESDQDASDRTTLGVKTTFSFRP
jgi:hypothetical protein